MDNKTKEGFLKLLTPPQLFKGYQNNLFIEF